MKNEVATVDSTPKRRPLLDCVRVHEETKNRFVSPLTLSFVQIPGTSWPSFFVGRESSRVNQTSTTSVYDRRMVTMSTMDTEFRFVRDFWQELTRVCPDEERQRDEDEGACRFDARAAGSFSWTTLTGSNPYVYCVLLRTIREMTRCRINYLHNYRYRVDNVDRPIGNPSDRDEFVDACLPCVLSLGASRLTLPQRVQSAVDTFDANMKRLKVLIIDMKQCENLLRQTIRSYYQNNLYGNDARNDANALALVVPSCEEFDREKAFRDVSACDVMVTLKRYVAFVSALQSRKWRTMDESVRLSAKLQRYERKVDVNEAIASDVYRVLVNQLQNERNSAMHLTQQLTAMRKMIDSTRQMLVEIYNRLYVTWEETNDLTIRLRDTLRAYRVEPMGPLRHYLSLDVYVLDFFRCLEIVRSTNMVLMKRIEDAYDDAFERVLPESMRVDAGRKTEVASSSSSLSSSLTPSSSSPLACGNDRVTVDSLLVVLNELNERILATREHYAGSEWEQGPMDIRHMVLAFNKAIDYRLILVRDSCESMATAATTTGRSFHDANDAIVRTLNELERSCAPGLFDARIKLNEGQLHKCRPLGDTIVQLRETQDAYDVMCLINLLEMQFDRLLTMRYSCGNERIDRDTENAKWDERRMLKELEQATRVTFQQNKGTWDGLLSRVRMYERENAFDGDTVDGLKPRELLSSRIEGWCFRPVDPFNFTQIHARFTQLDNPSELTFVQKIVSRYAYLLSWLLQMRMYVPFTDQDENAKDDVDEEYQESTVNEEENFQDSIRTKRIDAREKRKRQDDDIDDDDDDDDVVVATKKKKRDEKRGDDDVIVRENRKRPASDDNDENDETRKRFRRDDIAMCRDLDDSNRDEIMGTKRLGVDEDGDVIMENRRARKRPRGNDGDNGDDDEYGRLAKRCRGATMNLTKLQRLAENAPNSISVRLLNDAFRDETAKKRALRANIRKTLNNVVSLMNDDGR